MKSEKNTSDGKIIFDSIEELKCRISDIRQTKKLVFTNGCFDLLHPGHLYILNQAALEGDILVVGLNDDSSIKRLKGSNRPIIDQQARAEVVSALKMVDYVVFFSEETPYELIKELNPDVLVKGGEYGEGEIVGEDIAGRTVRVEMKPGYSTTEIVEKIKQIS